MIYKSYQKLLILEDITHEMICKWIQILNYYLKTSFIQEFNSIL